VADRLYIGLAHPQDTSGDASLGREGRTPPLASKVEIAVDSKQLSRSVVAPDRALTLFAMTHVGQVHSRRSLRLLFAVAELVHTSTRLVLDRLTDHPANQVQEIGAAAEQRWLPVSLDHTRHLAPDQNEQQHPGFSIVCADF
jgi:hypothetical protein